MKGKYNKKQTGQKVPAKQTASIKKTLNTPLPSTVKVEAWHPRKK